MALITDYSQFRESKPLRDQTDDLRIQNPLPDRLRTIVKGKQNRYFIFMNCLPKNRGITQDKDDKSRTIHSIGWLVFGCD